MIYELVGVMVPLLAEICWGASLPQLDSVPVFILAIYVGFHVNHYEINSNVSCIYCFMVTFSNRAPDPEFLPLDAVLNIKEGAFRAHTPWAGSSEEELESAGEVIHLLCCPVNTTTYTEG